MLKKIMSYLPICPTFNFGDTHLLQDTVGTTTSDGFFPFLVCLNTLNYSITRWLPVWGSHPVQSSQMLSWKQNEKKEKNDWWNCSNHSSLSFFLWQNSTKLSGQNKKRIIIISPPPLPPPHTFTQTKVSPSWFVYLIGFQQTWGSETRVGELIVTWSAAPREWRGSVVAATRTSGGSEGTEIAAIFVNETDCVKTTRTHVSCRVCTVHWMYDCLNFYSSLCCFGTGKSVLTPFCPPPSSPTYPYPPSALQDFWSVYLYGGSSE